MKKTASDRWPSIRVKFLLKKGGDNPVSLAEENLSVSFIPMEAIGEEGSLDISLEKSFSEVNTGYTLIQDGEVVVAKITPCFENGKGALIKGLSNGWGFGSTELYVLRPGPDLNEKFLYYTTVSDRFRRLGEAEMKGAAGQKRVPDEFIKNYRIPILPLPTQRLIAAYLDRETAHIDALIAAKERLLALLAEKRQALITRAVTRGLDENVKMKNSGVAWLGEVPEGWEVVQLRFVSNLIQTGPFGSQLHAEDYISNGIPVINPAHLKNGKITADFEVSIDERTHTRLSNYWLKVEDIVFARRGDLGRCGIVESSMESWLCGTGSILVRLEKTKLHPKYLALIFDTAGASEVLKLNSVGSTMDNLNTEIIGGFYTPKPPIDEQHKIVDFIEKQTNKIECLRQANERSIALLKERRSALITAAVTGRVELKE